MIVRGRPKRVRRRAGVVVRLVRVGGRQVAARCRAASARPRRRGVPQPVSESRPTGTARSRSPGSRRSRPLEQPLDLGRRERRVDARAAAPRPRRPAARRTTCRSRPGTRRGRSSSTASRRSRRSTCRRGCAGWSRRSGRRARRCRRTAVAVRVVGDGAVLADRADAEHVRQRGRVVGVAARASSAPACRCRPPRRRARPSSTRTRPRPPRRRRTSRARGRPGRGFRRS